MKKTITLMLCLLMVLCLCACGGSKNDAAGSYTFSETNMNGLEIQWTLELKEDGSYDLHEVNAIVGEITYPGTSYTVEDGVVSCGAMTSGPAFYVWANPAGFTATLNADGTFTPDQEGLEGVETDALAGILEAASGEPSAEPAA